MGDAERLKNILENLTGQEAPVDSKLHERAALLFQSGQGIGHSQFNELLLSFGYDRISNEFFQYLVDGTLEYRSSANFDSIEQLSERVDEFRKIAVLLFANVKFGFKQLSSTGNEEVLEEELKWLQPIDKQQFKERHSPINPIEDISGEDTSYLGYIAEAENQEKLKQNPDDEVLKELEEKRKEVVRSGIKNYEAYLTYDHLDVYVATSMRQKHEYFFVNRLIKEIFSHDELIELNIRYFDPTQAYCANRVDKGLFEALMLKRAKCTVYFVQETDTFGKDSELASTLAQGKPVVAFIPEVDDNYAERLIEDLQKFDFNQSLKDLIISQLQLSLGRL